MNRGTILAVAMLVSACGAVGAESALTLMPAPVPATGPASAADADPVAVLGSSGRSAVQREAAARLLLQQDTPQARQVIQRTLEDASDPQAQLAVARAISANGLCRGEYLVPLRLMMGNDRALTDAAAVALAACRDNPESLRLLINFASARQQREADRLVVIRALGSVTEKPAAEFLISLLLRDDDSQRIRNAAADALMEMTGHIENGEDPVLWNKWWNQNSARPEAQWKQELTVHQASQYVAVRQQYIQLASELQGILTRVYETTPPAQQAVLLLTYLRSSHPEIRRIGATVVHSEAMAAQPITAEAREQLRSMISDSSREVRLAVAGALQATNDPAALDPLLKQLSRESDPEVRAALAEPLARIGDLRAVSALRQLLSDPSLNVAAAGAAALRELGAVIREKEPALATAVAKDLQGALSRASTGPGAMALREAIADAMIPLREASLIPTFYQFLGESGSTRLRWAALRALGELRDPKAADTIARYLEDRESGVRLEAVRSLGKTSAVEHAELLYRRTSVVEETDPSVRDEAWGVLQGVFAKLPLEQLPAWVQRYPSDPGRRVVVLRAMAQRQEAAGDVAHLALSRQAIGVALMELDQPLEASTQFKAALDYFSGQADQQMVTEQLVEQYLRSLVRSRSTAQIVEFGSKLLTQRAAYQQTLGVLLRNEIRGMVDQKQYADAVAIIQASRKIEPPLAARYADDLDALGKEATSSMPAAVTTAPATQAAR